MFDVLKMVLITAGSINPAPYYCIVDYLDNTMFVVRSKIYEVKVLETHTLIEKENGVKWVTTHIKFPQSSFHQDIE